MAVYVIDVNTGQKLKRVASTLAELTRLSYHLAPPCALPKLKTK